MRFLNLVSKFFFLLPILLVGFAPLAFAESGINFDKEIVKYNGDGTHDEKLSVLLYDRVFDGRDFKDYIYADNGNNLELRTSTNVVTLDKTGCEFNVYDSSNNLLFSDSIIGYQSIVDSFNWSEVSSVNNASCNAFFDPVSGSLVSQKINPSAGKIEYKYIFDDGRWKTQLEVTNLSALSDRVFGFDQTITIPTDVVQFGSVSRNLDTFHNSVFDRNWIISNNSKVLDFLNGIEYDLSLGFSHLDSITVIDSGVNSSKLVFHFLNNNSILLPGDTLIIDPTYSSTSGGAFTPLYGSANTRAGIYVRTSSSVLNGLDMSEVSFYLKKVGSPTGTLSLKIYDSGGTLQYTSPTTFDVSTFTSWSVVKSFVALYTLSTGDKIAVEYSGGDASNNVQVEYSATGTFDGTDTSLCLYAGSWLCSPTYDNYDYKFDLVYTTVSPPDPIMDLSSSSIGKTFAFLTWTEPALNGEALITYSLNYTTPTGNPLTFLANTTNIFYNMAGLTASTNYSVRVTAVTAGGLDATGNIYNFTTSSFDPPGTPTLGANALSDSAIRFTSVAGTAGSNSTLWYGLQCELNGAGSWTSTVSNSTLPASRIYEYSGLTFGDSLICQWRDGSVDGWSPWSNNATDTLTLSVVSAQRTDASEDKLLEFINFVTAQGGVYFGLGVIPFAVMLIGFMAGKKTVRIFTLITLSLMGIIHASGYYVYPNWYWTLCLLLGIGLVLGRQKSD